MPLSLTEIRPIFTVPPVVPRGQNKRSTSQRLGPLLNTCIGALAILTLAELHYRVLIESPRVMSGISALCIAWSLLTVRHVYKSAESSASFIFVLLVALLNLGLVPFLFLNARIPTFGLSEDNIQWIAGPYLSPAIYLASLGLLAATTGILAGRAWNLLFARPRKVRDASHDAHTAEALGIPGAALMLVAVLLFGYFGFRAGGFHAFTGGYEHWLKITASQPLPYVYAVIGFSVAVLILASPSNGRRLGLSVFVVWAASVLSIGFRSEVIFSLASCVVMLGFSRRVLTGKRLLVILLIGLTVGAGVRSYRVVSASGSPRELALSPELGIAEVGFSLRPTTVVVEWHANGQSLLHGASFFSPVDRAARKLLPFLHSPAPASQDPDVLNAVILKDVGPVGFSQIAEGYDNWGLAGVIGFLFVLGLIMSWIDRSPPDIRSKLIRNAILLPILIEARNSFTPILFEVGIGLLIAYGSVFFAAHVAVRPDVPQPRRVVVASLEHTSICTTREGYSAGNERPET